MTRYVKGSDPNLPMLPHHLRLFVKYSSRDAAMRECSCMFEEELG